ncbi:MAG: serine/threonine protein kinase, partial [Gammaproteobacteria bacterium]|nr:serine/threonine protein kinase [Gammaproteobacteria bacterium]
MGTKTILPLPAETKISHYQIKQVIGGGGFSIVYLATNLKTGAEVVVKEYMPAKLARRDADLSVHPKDFSTEKLYKLG